MGTQAERTIAIVGLGKVAESHLVAYRKLDGVRLVGVVEPRSERCQAIAHEYGVPGYASVEELLLKSRPDIACILTPARTHRALTEKCAAAGVHVLSEKPMAVTLEDANAMAQACARSGVQFFYGSSYRFLPAVRAARDLIAANEIGAVRLIFEQVITGKGADAYRAMPASHYPEGGPGGGGYGLVDHGVHMMDAFPWLCGSRIVQVFGRGDRTGGPAQPEYGLMMMENGALGVVLYDGSTWPINLPAEGLFSQGRRWVADHGWIGETGTWEETPGCITVYGTTGSIRIFHYANRLFVNQNGSIRERAVGPGATPMHFAAQLKEFCRSLDAGEVPTTSAQDGIRALQAVLGAYESEAGGTWQAIR